MDQNDIRIIAYQSIFEFYTLEIEFAPILDNSYYRLRQTVLGATLKSCEILCLKLRSSRKS